MGRALQEGVLLVPLLSVCSFLGDHTKFLQNEKNCKISVGEMSTEKNGKRRK